MGSNRTAERGGGSFILVGSIGGLLANTVIPVRSIVAEGGVTIL